VARLPVGTGPAVRMIVFGEARSLASTAGRSRLLIAGILFGFSMLALTLSAFLVRENARLHERVSRQALTDERTGLPNLRALHGTLDREIEGSRRYGSPVSLVMLDIDGFANVNKELGHQQGDKVLASVGRVLRELSRGVDVPARYGGEEFAVVLPRTDAQGGVQLAERMRAAIERLRVRRLSGAGAVGVTASFGVASVTVGAHEDGSSTLRSLISAADDALLRAKRAGKNRVERA
jgi:diguanylate cyclase (GGDEF)-like protein